MPSSLPSLPQQVIVAQGSHRCCCVDDVTHSTPSPLVAPLPHDSSSCMEEMSMQRSKRTRSEPVDAALFKNSPYSPSPTVGPHVASSPKACGGSCDSSVELWLPTCFTTACGRPICIREKRILCDDEFKLLRRCALDEHAPPIAQLQWRAPRPLIQERSRSESPQRHSRTSFTSLLGSTCSTGEARPVTLAAFTGFTTASGDMLFHRH